MKISSAELVYRYVSCEDSSCDYLSYCSQIRFISPILSVTLAAGRSRHQKSIAFDQTCRSYAENIGLTDIFDGNDPNPVKGGNLAETYSPLTKLSNHNEVECCNRVISTLFHNRLSGPTNEKFLGKVVEVVGELHDNIPSHSNGVGYSAAQVYQKGERQLLQFAIADNGIGLLGNVLKVDGSTVDHASAIRWCFQNGNTSARPREDWAQRVPDDMVVSPFPPSVSTFSNENHHAGKGLWILSELIRLSGGQMAVWTGDVILEYRNNGWRPPIKSSCWNGLAIEVELDIQLASQILPGGDEDFNSLGERLGF